MSGAERHNEVQSPFSSPLFTLGAHIISHIPRQWERFAAAPLRRHQRKGTKLWKRPGAQGNESKASVQLLQDLQKSTELHTVKRQRMQLAGARKPDFPETVDYKPTVLDVGTPGLRRKMTTKMSDNRSPRETPSKAVSVSPSKRPRRRSSRLSGIPTDEPHSDTSHLNRSPEQKQRMSFLDAADIHGSTMFDQNFTESETDGPTTEEPTNEASNGSDNISVTPLLLDDEQAADESDDNNESPARLLDAGNTGVVHISSLEGDLLGEDEVSSPARTEDFDETAVQDEVAELLETPPGEREAVEDELAATPSRAANVIAPVLELASEEGAGAFQAPQLAREDSISTVAFDDLDVTGLTFGNGFIPQCSSAADLTVSRDANEPESPVISRSIVELQPQKSPSKDVNSTDDAEESADELISGAILPQRLILSPSKSFSPQKSTAASPSPRKLRPAPRLSDDTVYLNDFLTRVRSQAAARTQETAQSPEPEKTVNVAKSPRKILGTLDPNSPTPSPSQSKPLETSDSTQNFSENTQCYGSPTKFPKTPTSRVLLESNMDSPETPEELNAESTISDSTKTEDNRSTRRSTRPRGITPSRLPLNAPSNIPLRRAGGDPPVLQRSDAQRLARTTAANTRRNKGGARFPKQVIESLDSERLSPVKQKGIVKNKKGQNVDWDHRLVYFLEDTGKEVEIDAEGRLIEKENGQEVKRKVRIVKGERVDEEPNFVDKLKSPAAMTTGVSKALAVNDSPIAGEINKGRKVKISPSSSSSSLARSADSDFTAADTQIAPPHSVSHKLKPKLGTTSSVSSSSKSGRIAKPKSKQSTAPSSTAPPPVAATKTKISVKGTPVAKRMLSVVDSATSATSATSASSARRKTSRRV